jgi:hypothetical protein
MYLQSIKSVKHNVEKSVNRSIVKKSRHIGFGVFIVHSSNGPRQCSTDGPPLSAGHNNIRRRSSVEKAGVASLGATLNSAIASEAASDLSGLLRRMAEADSRRDDGALSKTTPPLSLMEVLKCVERRRRRENQENLSAASSCSDVIGQLARRTLALRYVIGRLARRTLALRYDTVIGQLARRTLALRYVIGQLVRRNLALMYVIGT